MSKKIFELAKDWNMMAALLIQQSKELGVQKPTNFTSLTEEQIAELKVRLSGDTATLKTVAVSESEDAQPRVVRRRISSKGKTLSKPAEKIKTDEKDTAAKEAQQVDETLPVAEATPAVEATQKTEPTISPPVAKTALPKTAKPAAAQPNQPAKTPINPSLPAKAPLKVVPPARKIKKWVVQTEERTNKVEFLKRVPAHKLKKLRGKNKIAKQIINPRKKEIKISNSLSIHELSGSTGISVNAILKTMSALELERDVHALIDGEIAQLVAGEHGVDVHLTNPSPESALQGHVGNPADLKPRPPIVTIMGHVDHGKTSLLDQIYQTSIAEKEAGGITQQIGAYSVGTPNGQITFIDTPGHEAFTSMRVRGANVTDIVVLVVAADDGVKPQTIEAIHHAKAANAPVLVAINKCDKNGANPEAVMQALMAHELVAGKYGGDCTMVEVSAKTKHGIPELLEMILLQAETMELSADIKAPAQGYVIESRLDKGLGNLVTFLLQSGQLKVGDFVVAGEHYGKIRRMQSHTGQQIKIATPSLPVEILGLHGMPAAGEAFQAVKDEKTAKKIIDFRHNKSISAAQKPKDTSADAIFQDFSDEQKSKLNLLIKADTHGCLEALEQTIKNQSTEEIEVQVVHKAIGAINLSDVSLAQTSQALIIGFNVRPDAKAKKQALTEKINIQFYSVIYDVVNEIQKLIKGLLEPVEQEEIQGKANIQEIFNLPKIGFIAGCKVQDGKIVRDSFIRVLRDNIVIHDGRLASLRRFKDDVKEVASGFECGLKLDNYKDLRVGDSVESYKRVMVNPIG